MKVIVIPSDPGDAPDNRPGPTREFHRGAIHAAETEDDAEAVLTNALRNILTIASFPEFVGDADGALESIKGITHRALESASDEPI
jgi:hypothetical protein